ncbi:MAG: class I SAM-dependent methyltransferase [Nitrospirae bacterium]|nr:MAG: class I SAM-dependent methyltransferase [Nitrospirota bacterium]
MGVIVDQLALTDDVLALRAWRMPDMVVYQHADDEWWLTPLDDAVPLVRVNRAGASLLAAMDGQATVGSLLEKFGNRACGAGGETGRACLERWSLPRYSLCYYGAEVPAQDRGEARWGLLLLKIREGWSASTEFEGAGHLADFHSHDIATHKDHFEVIETTVSHLFREPTAALEGLTYGRLLAHNFRKLGWWTRKPRTIVEVGGGLGYVARELGKGLAPEEREGVRYVFLDITRPFLASQLELGKEGGWHPTGLQANGEFLPLKDASVDLIVDNENMADMTPVKLSRQEAESGRGATPLHQEALDWIRRAGLSLDKDMPAEFIFNLGPLRFLREVWRVLKPGGRAFLVEFGIEQGWSAPVKLPGHTEYETHFGHLRQAARWLGFQEKYGALPQFLGIKPDTRVLCTGAAYAIRRFCEAEGRPFAIRAYTEAEFTQTLGDMLPRLLGHHYHDISDPAWFGLGDFKVLLLEKPAAAPPPKPQIKDVKGFRWGGMR